MGCLYLPLFIRKHNLMSNKEHKLNPFLHCIFIYDKMQWGLILWTIYASNMVWIWIYGMLTHDIRWMTWDRIGRNEWQEVQCSNDCWKFNAIRTYQAISCLFTWRGVRLKRSSRYQVKTLRLTYIIESLRYS